MAGTALAPAAVRLAVRRRRSTARWLLRHGYALLAVVCVVCFVGLLAWQGRIGAADHPPVAVCAAQALRTLAVPSDACVATVRRIVDAVPPGGPSRWAFEEPGWPRLAIWADTVLLPVFVILLVATALRGRGIARRHAPGWQGLFLLTTAVAVAAALLHAIGNFWLLAHIGVAGIDGDELRAVAAITAWRFRMDAAALGLVGAWTLLRRRRRR